MGSPLSLQSRILGLLVTSDAYKDHLLGLCRAAAARKIRVRVFLTHQGVRLAMTPAFEELSRLAEVRICREGFERQYLDAAESEALRPFWGSQSDHADLMDECDRYLVL